MIKKIVIQRLWTMEELEIVVDMMKQGCKLTLIAERLNRSYGSLQVKLKAMGKDLWDRSSWSRYISKRTRNYWTYEELYDAKLVLECGGTFAEAAKKTSHSSGSLISKINMMGSDFDVYSWVDDNYKYEELKTTARSVTKGTVLKRFIGSVWHQINETREYESQFYIANVTDRGHHGEFDDVPVYITEMDDDFRKDFNKNRRFKKINKT